MTTDAVNNVLILLQAAEESDRRLDANIAEALGNEIAWKQANYTMTIFAVITFSPREAPSFRTGRESGPR